MQKLWIDVIEVAVGVFESRNPLFGDSVGIAACYISVKDNNGRTSGWIRGNFVQYSE